MRAILSQEAIGRQIAHARRTQEIFEKEREKRLNGRVYRPIEGVKISEDYGKSWKLRALCDECLRSIEPPMQRRKQGTAGAANCDWCGAKNELYA
jgi:hypothetical protein